MISDVRNILETTEEVGIFFSKKREQQSPPKPSESQRQNCNLNFVTGSNLPFGHENLHFLKCRGHFPITFICTAKAHIVSEFATPNLHHIVQLKASLSLKKLLCASPKGFVKNKAYHLCRSFHSREVSHQWDMHTDKRAWQETSNTSGSSHHY